MDGGEDPGEFPIKEVVPFWEYWNIFIFVAIVVLCGAAICPVLGFGL
jgi:hypothetical protein